MIINVSGTSSNTGKTTLICSLLRNLNDFNALKVTICREGHACPRKMPCGVCGTLKQPYRIIEDLDVINQLGKDTRKFVQAGAKKVYWLQSKEEYLKEALEKTFERINGNVIIEGNSALRWIKPDLSIMVKGNEIKESAKNIMDKVDVFVESSDIL